MSLNYFPHQAIDGSWHTVYRIPGSSELHSVSSGPTEAGAAEDAARLNREAAAEALRMAEQLAARDISQRRLVRGFYTDLDAA